MENGLKGILFNKKTICSLLLVSVLLLAAVFKNNALYYAVIIGVVCFIKKTDILFPVYFFSSLSTNFFDMGGGMSIGRFLSLLFIISCLFNLIREKKLIYKDFQYVFLLIVFTFLSGILGYGNDIIIFINMLINLLVFYLFSKIKNVDLDWLLIVLAFSSLLMVGVLLHFFLTNGALLLDERFNMEGDVNANRIAMMSEQCGSILLGYVFLGKHRLLKALFIVPSFLAIFIIIVTGSRSALIGLSAASLVCMWLFFTNRKSTGVVVLILVIALGCVVFRPLLKTDSLVTERFSVDDVVESGGTGRLDNAKDLFTLFPNHLLFGSGIGAKNMQALIRQSGLHGDAAHNIIIDPLTQMGIIGFALYLILIISVIRKEVFLFGRRIGQVSILLLPFVAATFNGVGEIVFYEKLFWNDMAVIMLTYNTLLREKRIVNA